MRRRITIGLVVAAVVAAVSCSPPAEDDASETSPTPGLVAADSLDLSGLVWLDGESFLGVHDSKDDERARLSVVTLPDPEDDSKHQPEWRNVDVDWPNTAAPRDMESAARIPETDLVLVAESGQESEGDQRFNRIFLMELDDETPALRETVEWPVEIENVEGTAVAQIGRRLVFLYAERAQGERTTKIRWATLRTDPLRFGEFTDVTLANPEEVGPQSRPVSAIDVAEDGSIYIASAIDPDVDAGPFASDVWRIGRVQQGTGGAEVVLEHDPEHLGTVNGFKIESVAVRSTGDERPEVFFGTDDENFGGVLRPLPE